MRRTPTNVFPHNNNQPGNCLFFFVTNYLTDICQIYLLWIISEIIILNACFNALWNHHELELSSRWQADHICQIYFLWIMSEKHKARFSRIIFKIKKGWKCLLNEIIMNQTFSPPGKLTDFQAVVSAMLGRPGVCGPFQIMGIIIIIIITSPGLYSHAWNIMRYKPTCDLVTCNVLLTETLIITRKGKAKLDTTTNLCDVPSIINFEKFYPPQRWEERSMCEALLNGSLQWER